jgi:hypothetical protein
MTRISFLFLLAGCSIPGQRLIADQTPPVRATNGGNASLEILACVTPSSAAATEKLLNQMLMELQNAGVLVTADNSTARLTISFCPG